MSGDYGYNPYPGGDQGGQGYGGQGYGQGYGAGYGQNPYGAPMHGGGQYGGGQFGGRPDDILRLVKPPAIAMLVISIIGLVLLLLSIAMSLFEMMSPQGAMVDPRTGMPRSTVLTIRLVWAVVQLLVDLVTLVAAIKMMKLESHGFARMASILMIIPCFSLCCVIGIPFGIWSLVVLNKPEVAAAFRS